MPLSSRLSTLAFFVRLALQPGRSACPNCGHSGQLVTRKYLFASLRRCGHCQMLFRAPTDRSNESVEFYQEEYAEGATTTLPSADQLEELKHNGFVGMECNYAEYIRVLRQLGFPAGSRLFDFGCSWGYGSYQLAQAGFKVKSFEVSRPRAAYGRDHLQVDLVDDFDRFVRDNEASFDLFFSAHVLEHVPSPSRVLESALKLLRPGGMLVSFMPNGSESYREQRPANWQSSWGKVHPNLIDERFLRAALSGRNGVLATTPVELSADYLADVSKGSGTIISRDPLDREELFVLAIK